MLQEKILELGTSLQTGGVLVCQSVFASHAAATLKTVSSSKGLPIICNPRGSFADEKPHGIDMAGSPEQLNGLVKRTQLIMTGSSYFPYLYVFWSCFAAGAGVVGVTSTSTLSNTFRRESWISFRTFNALR